MMPLPLDHVILMVDDLDTAAAAWEARGFQVTPTCHHPFGTANRLVMFAADFVELLAVVDREAARQKGGERFLRARAAGCGLFAIALRSDDIHADRERLVASGLAVAPVRGFRRPVTLPGGVHTAAVVETCWITTEAEDGFAVFLSQQHVPEAVWVPQWMHHRNGACGIRHLALSSRRPEALSDLLRRCGVDGCTTTISEVIDTTWTGRHRIAAISIDGISQGPEGQSAEGPSFHGEFR
jgi:hypothetical protein